MSTARTKKLLEINKNKIIVKKEKDENSDSSDVDISDDVDDDDFVTDEEDEDEDFSEEQEEEEEEEEEEIDNKRKLKKSKKTTTSSNRVKKIKDEDDIKDNKISSSSNKSVNHSIKKHYFKKEEIDSIRKSLLKWYDGCKRDLPWRQRDGFDRQTIAYRVWVSEIMLQQTRVAVVIDYFNRWMTNWPTIKNLANATLDQVNETWAGLGYYRRARNLHLAATRLVADNGAVIPDKLEKLRDVEGVGPYTAGAILSIAFEKAEPLVDGNVIRVLSRLRMIGANPKKSATTKLHWKLAGELVDPVKPGDFNQALMELGATVCLVTSPNCGKCPVSDQCLAYQETLKNKKKPTTANSIMNYFATTTTTNTTTTTKGIKKEKEEKEVKVEQKVLDIENLCNVCESWSDSDEPVTVVTKFPKKVVKAKAREETVDVFIVIDKEKKKCLLVQRPSTGLLASLWESPSKVRESEESNEDDEEDDDEDKSTKKRKRVIKSKTSKNTNTSNNSSNNNNKREIFNNLLKEIIIDFNDRYEVVSDIKSIGSTVHIFSHIRQTLNVSTVYVTCKDEGGADEKNGKNSKIKNKKNIQWIDQNKIASAAISNQMKKCYQLAKLIPK